MAKQKQKYLIYWQKRFEHVIVRESKLWDYIHKWSYSNIFSLGTHTHTGIVVQMWGHQLQWRWVMWIQTQGPQHACTAHAAASTLFSSYVCLSYNHTSDYSADMPTERMPKLWKNHSMKKNAAYSIVFHKKCPELSGNYGTIWPKLAKERFIFGDEYLENCLLCWNSQYKERLRRWEDKSLNKNEVWEGVTEYKNLSLSVYCWL